MFSGCSVSSLAARFAFFPPDPPTYSVKKDDGGRLAASGVPRDHSMDVLIVLFFGDPREPIYDYSGYGASTGKILEPGALVDGLLWGCRFVTSEAGLLSCKNGLRRVVPDFGPFDEQVSNGLNCFTFLLPPPLYVGRTAPQHGF
ncbi:hypothetical protein C4D60_Mb07t10890 [Musa balbisiana]|uniref:Uncharacterized protein n=1 Tax=Musa balbisiana TaxID=52838 RepID=A0A4S8JEF2_MUSBA|nr:hypothetical protein C4D60_Mb07t10890 [Musa balbisiana]